MELLAVCTYWSGRKYLRFTLASVFDKTLDDWSNEKNCVLGNEPENDI